MGDARMYRLKKNNTSTEKTGRLRKVVTGGLVCGLALCALVFFYRITGFGIPCVFHRVTGLYCPGCGTFRALDALLHGQWLQAIRYNALLVILGPVLVILLVFELWRYLRNEPINYRRYDQIAAIILIIICLGYGIVRNLPAFYVLQPTVI